MFPIKYIDNNLVWNKDNEVFAYYELIPYNYSFLSAEQKFIVHDSFRQLIAQSREGKIHALQIATESSIRSMQEQSKKLVTGKLKEVAYQKIDEQTEALVSMIGDNQVDYRFFLGFKLMVTEEQLNLKNIKKSAWLTFTEFLHEVNHTLMNDFVSMPNDEINRYMKMEKLLENKISRRFKVRRLEINDFGYLMEHLYGRDGIAYSFIGVLMCNQSLFDEYGLEIPKTMDDLYAVSATFNENGITPIAMGEKDKWPGLFPFGALALRYGGVEKTITMLNGEGNFDQEFVQKTAEELQKMVDEGVFASDSVALTDDEATEEFRQGRAAMWYSGNWKVDLLCEEGSPLEGKLTMVNWPAVSGADGDQNSFVGGASATLVASATSAHKKEAVEFMTFMSEHFSNYAYEEGAILPTWKYSGDMELKPFQQTLLDLMQGADGFCLAWDTLLDPETADVHSTSLQGIYAQQMTADDYVEAMAATR